MAEWLRRWTRNPLGSARVSSNLTGVDFTFFAPGPLVFKVLLVKEHKLPLPRLPGLKPSVIEIRFRRDLNPDRQIQSLEC